MALEGGVTAAPAATDEPVWRSLLTAVDEDVSLDMVSESQDKKNYDI